MPHTVVDASGSEATGADLTEAPAELATITQAPPLSDTVVTKADPESTPADASQLTPGENIVTGFEAGDDGPVACDVAGFEGFSGEADGSGEAEATADSDGEADNGVELVEPTPDPVGTQLASTAITAAIVTATPQFRRSACARIKAAYPSPRHFPERNNRVECRLLLRSGNEHNRRRPDLQD